jgi:hypothetical protein
VVKVYAMVLVLGVLGLIVLIVGDALAENLDRPGLSPSNRLGKRAVPIVAAGLGFGMGGMSAEFAPVEISWPFALLIALVAAIGAVVWAHYARGRAGAA